MAALDQLRRPVARADALMNRLYGWRGNPLYHSGVLTVALLAVVMVTGLYLLLFYRLGAPYPSVERITHSLWLGSWMRSLHRYASDAALLAALVHLLRMLVQRRSWGPRVLAWVSGLVLLGLLLVCGWTGYVMVWDVQGVVLAREGARLFDALPLFSEPIERAFDGTRPLPAAFFFLNLFAHVALPVGLGVVLWLHVSRVARPALVPPRPLLITSLAALGLASALLPVTMAPPAELLRTAERGPYDLFFVFFVPVTRLLPPAVALLGLGLPLAVLVVVPWLTRPRPERRPPPSSVDEELCTGCEQCYLDCPYEAISMVTREPVSPRSVLVARVNPDLCTSCGICAGSCAPMGVGPPGRTGRDQLANVRAFAGARDVRGRVVLVACSRGAGGAVGPSLDGSPLYPVSCSGNLHTSVVEYLVRAGASGVLIASCPPRDCWNREGSRWLEQRLYHEREAELQERVDRRRVRLCWAGEAEGRQLLDALHEFRGDLAALDAANAEAEPDVGRRCELPAKPLAGRTT